MPTESAQPDASARKLVQVLMRRIAKIKNQALADALDKDESTISRIISGEGGIKMADLQPFLKALSLKVVDINQHCVPLDEFNAYRTLARVAVNNQLEDDWDEPA